MFVSNAVVSGRYVLRACIVNFHTTVADVESTVDIAATNGARSGCRAERCRFSAAVTLLRFSGFTTLEGT